MALPLEDWLKNFSTRFLNHHKDERICVVSVIGKGRLSENWCKATLLNDVVDVGAFGSTVYDTFDCKSDVASSGMSAKIEIFYSVDVQTVFLQCITPNDLTFDVLTTNEFELLDEEGIHAWLASREAAMARCYLLMFSISHIVLVVHPNCVFDVSYIRLLRSLDTLRLRALPKVSERLKKLTNLSKAWIASGRVCSPRLLFCFHRSPVRPDPDKRANPVKKLEHCMEDQIYRVLRKSHVVTNTSNNSLCAVPSNDAFVYVVSCDEEQPEPIAQMLEEMRRRCEDPGYVSEEQKENGSATFVDFLMQHIDTAHRDGFDDNIGRNPAPRHFELPRLKNFIRVAKELVGCFLLDEDGVLDAEDYVEPFDVELRFSESRCAKVLPIAFSTYQEGLPQYYSGAQHQLAMAQALQALAVQARGPSLEACKQQLLKMCDAHWKNGRQSCEVLSLTGTPCANKVHTSDADWAVKHCSGVKYVSTCNCGRRQAVREDPFDVKDANYTFYADTPEFFLCCKQLLSADFPVFQPSTPDVKAAKLGERLRAITVASQSQELRDAPSDGSDYPLRPPSRLDFDDAASHDSQLSQSALETVEAERQAGSAPRLLLGEVKTQDEDGKGADVGSSSEISAPEEMEPELDTASNAPFEEPAAAEVRDTKRTDGTTIARTATADVDIGYDSQASTIEYLPGMLHSQSPPGLLPLFPSWALLCIGSSSLYSHSHGLRDQPNFTHGSSYLLPWDVGVRVDLERWQAQMEAMIAVAKPGSVPLRKHVPKRNGAVNVKIFIGFEYECPRGHRFMLQDGNAVLKSTGAPKDSAANMMRRDLPLYFPCSCRTSAAKLLGQLMRVHVVTPKAPVYVTLNPRVQPFPPTSPVFFPGNVGPIKLPPAEYWILRLPFVYVGDHGPFYAPKEPTPCGRMLRGLIGIVQMDEVEWLDKLP